MMRDWLADRRYLALLVVIALAILTVGSWMRPRRRPAEVVVSEAERLRLQMLSQKRGLQDVASYFGQLAQDMAVYVVRVKEAGASGVIWEAGGGVLTPAPAGSYPSEFTLLRTGQERKAAPLNAAPGAPLWLLRGEQTADTRAAEVVPGARPLPGAWVLLVARTEDGEVTYAQGVYSAAVECQCEDHQFEELVTTFPVNQPMLGGGVFDLDGRLVGVVLPCGTRYVAISAATVQSLLHQAERPQDRLLPRYGVRLAALDGEAARYFRTTQGALVSEVWEGSPAEQAALAPGDIILRWNGEPLGKAEDWERLGAATPGEAPRLEVQRGRRTLRLTMEPAPAGWWSHPGRRTAFGVRLDVPAPGYAIESVEPGSRGQAAGLRTGDRLLAVDGRAVSGPGVLRDMLAPGAAKPLYVVVKRGARRLGVLVP